MTTTEATILAVVEGLTEYLPVSSTGHLILAEAFLKMQKSGFNNLYIINIQFGAILSVIVLYWRRFFQSFDFYVKLLVAFIPAAIFGVLLDDFIDTLLSSVVTVAISLIVGGVILIFIDRIFHKQLKATHEDDARIGLVKKDTPPGNGKGESSFFQKINVGYVQALVIGCFQCIAMIPGVSRSAATIVGGLQQGFNIKKAAEFSFFLAVPTIAAASLYKLLKNFDEVRATDTELLLIGNVVSFIVGMIAIKFFITLITRYGMKFFGYYRIILGMVLLGAMALGYKLEISEL
jgi:undecaprenyl-diphosphatase